ncbi:MAG: anhydro-N-acetylmuramic acid kinase [Bacteroidales bacterium]|jgi:anhydro-N-acetylmuramic acid kinase|nr:anhydro-N-acetylmuramic acid kinase [Bacteroidales bacterium]
MHSYKAIGIMSGTSLDGLDIVLSEFTFQSKWSFSILKYITVDYSDEWKEKLSNAATLNGLNLSILNKRFGKFIGESVLTFLENTNFKIDLIASHGHTVFHQPEKKLTLQIGDGNEIASATEITTISDFRSLDVALGGHGAPLVPIGDKLLFSEYDYCINIGGFANISFDKDEIRFAYDICPANIILNSLANKLGSPFDKGGKLGRLGKINSEFLKKLNNLDYYNKIYPKSLGKEWLDTSFTPIIKDFKITTKDQIRTIYEHIAQQISSTIPNDNKYKTLITGGGAYNDFLLELIKQKTKSQIIIPNNIIIEYKEALIFAFLGVLKLENKVNCLSSVTGAKRDSSGGVIC